MLDQALPMRTSKKANQPKKVQGLKDRIKHDGIKIALLFIIAVIFVAYFLLQGLTADNYSYFLSKRTPKILALIMAGVAIGVSSLAFQTITNNRILTPSILGFDSLYVMIQVGLLMLFGGISPLINDAKINFILSTTIMVGLALTMFYFYFKKSRQNIFNLLLIGIILSGLFSSVTNFFTLVIDPDEFAIIQNSMFASFNNVNSELVYWCVTPLLLLIFLLYRQCNQLDVMWLGVDNATSLGIDTNKLMMTIMVLVSFLIAISTALVGPVLFFGLIVVSVTRQVFHHFSHRILFVAVSIISIVILVAGQWFVENILDFNTTLSVLINLVGGSYFLWLLARQKF